MKEMNIQFHKTRPQNPFDDGAKARLHRMGLLRIDGSVDEATLNALSRAYAALRTFRNGQKAMWATAPQMIWLQGMAMDATAPMTLLLLRRPAR